MKRNKKWQLLVVSSIVIIAVLVQVPNLYRWRKTNDDRAISLSNIRRLTASLQLYMQDYDGLALPVEATKLQNHWVTWPIRLKGYGLNTTILNNPSNPILPEPGRLTDPLKGYPIQSSYAINYRLENLFSKGPFPMDNLEMPELTAIFVEAGPMRLCPDNRECRENTTLGVAVDKYYDTTDRYQGYVPYPSLHDGTLIVGSADGHAVAVHVEHYTQDDGPHNRTYGRLGGRIYNWNGGHPNGATDRAPFE